MAPIIGYVSKRIPRIYLAQAAFFSIPISLSLYGPSKFLNFPQKLPLMLPGNVCMGISNSLMVVPLIAEIIDAVKQKEKVDEKDHATSAKISDLASGLYSSCNALGSFSAPIVGGLINEVYGFRSTCDIMAVSSFSFGVIYLAVNTIPYIIAKRSKKSNK